MSIVLHHITYIHPDEDVLFQDISLVIPPDRKIALIGNNGSGKSTLLQLMAGMLHPQIGQVSCSSRPYYVPQQLWKYDYMTIAGALDIHDKMTALNAIANGDASIDNFTLVDDDWEIEERALQAMSSWNLGHLSLSDPMANLSGGEKTKVFLAGLFIHQPKTILMDEPTNHLDMRGKTMLYDYIQSSKATIVVVSHDRTLLNLLNYTYELSKDGITAYGGNYDFYKQQKDQQVNALQLQLDEQAKELRLARKTAREVMERKQKLDARGKKLSNKKGLSKMGMNKLRDNSERSSFKLKEKHTEKIGTIAENIAQLRIIQPASKQLKMDFMDASVHTGKVLLTALDINYSYGTRVLWDRPLSFQLLSGERIALNGMNGSGKTTLINLILGKMMPSQGTITSAGFSHVYIDQTYSLIDDTLSVLQLAQSYNTGNLLEHELKIRLHRSLFPRDTWDKPCGQLSGGEKMRLMFCCSMISNNTPDLFVLDEPTNNLDIESLEIVTATIKEYEGTVLVVSHDQYFLEEIGVSKYLTLLEIEEYH